MSEKAFVTISETCRCGCSTNVAMPERGDAEDLVKTWREQHPCMSRRRLDEKDDPQPSGSGASIGFAPNLKSPWPGWGGEGPQTQ